MKSLSSLDRPALLGELRDCTFDLIVIGGGITGAGIALDASSRGLRVALIEKEDFAAGTSSKSTKLIHGGLRYLKQFEIGLVREVGRERAIVHHVAPHLVLAEKMLLPLIKGGTYGEFATSMGLWVYDILAGVNGDDKRVMLNKKETLRKEPLLREDILMGSGYYAEYRTDDARLTIENIKTAAQYGALSINYVKAEGFIYKEDGQVAGVNCKDMNTGDEFNIKARYVVSAAGPWVDKIRKMDHTLQGKHLFLSKGVHIVVPHSRFPLRQSVYFDNMDGRMIFAIPRNRVTYIGTTDTPYDGDLNHIPINQEEVNYLLEAVNLMFPTINLRTEDVESSWAGLRPLIHEEGKSASEMSRKDEIFESGNGLISIAGGKLTGYRKMAERVVDLIAKKYQHQYEKKLKRNFTDTIPLTGGPFSGPDEVNVYQDRIQKSIESLKLPSYLARYLVTNYGRQTDSILDEVTSYNQRPEIALMRAEASFTIRNELALSLLDFFTRRSGRLYFDLPSIRPALKPLAGDFAEAFGWKKQKKKEEMDRVEAAIRHVTEFESASETTVK
jgi:glycerol-3-phosphate dehydrogenase